jgi:SNF2 family DNA or RNA helicase
MGLGKTVEAIAVLAHLRSAGETHFVVVCPAAVVTNWVREVGGKSRLRAHRVHGPDRERAARSWARDGGVAVTTFETLKWWEPALARVRDLACVVVDEAHYIKNPAANRSVRTADLIARADRAILLTGTPLENRVEEFRTLVSYLRPDLTAHADDLSARTFRRRIAPAYLRRNQEDVLTELPELIEVDEWLPLSSAEASAYRSAVLQGNFMAMRQAAMLQGKRSEKVQRLVEIVREAEANERRVIVFSYFREVLELVARELPKPVFGPLNGSVPAVKRQEAIDRFAAARHGAVLVAQIEALGVGLNIQSASVVVLCEPQLKPTTEAQAQRHGGLQPRGGRPLRGGTGARSPGGGTEAARRAGFRPRALKPRCADAGMAGVRASTGTGQLAVQEAVEARVHSLTDTQQPANSSEPPATPRRVGRR